jgi:hypothetical protein
VDVDVEERRSEPLDPPKRRAEVRRRPSLWRVEPERAGNVQPLQRPLVERDERDHSLRTQRQPYRTAVDLHLEPVEQPERELARSPVGER